MLVSLMQGAHDRLRTMRATVRHWYNPELRYRAFHLNMPPRAAGGAIGFPEDPDSEVFTRLWVEHPSRLRAETKAAPGGRLPGVSHASCTKVIDGDTWWTHDPHYGVRTGSHHPESSSWLLTGLEHLLDPKGLLDELELQIVGETVVAGRSGIQARAAPTGPRTTPLLDLTRGADEYQLVVDAESGFLLRVVAQFEHWAFDVKEMIEVAVDEPLPSALFRFEPPPGESPRPLPEPRQVSIEECTRLAPFTVFIPTHLPVGEAGMHVLYTPGWGRPAPGPTVSVTYFAADAKWSLFITESPSPGCWPADAGWEVLDMSGLQFLLSQPRDGWYLIQVHTDSTSISIQSDLARETLLAVASSLAPVASQPGGGVG